MKYEYYVLIRLDNGKATATLLTGKEAEDAGYSDGYYVLGDLDKGEPDFFLDGYKTLGEAIDVFENIQAGIF